MDAPIPTNVHRFLLTSVPTVPHLETLLLLWREPDAPWSTADIARRLFIPPDRAAHVADELCRAELLTCAGNPPTYRCRREPPDLLALLGEVDSAYSRHLREVTQLIHSNLDRKAERFAQAFTWGRK